MAGELAIVLYLIKISCVALSAARVNSQRDSFYRQLKYGVHQM